MTSATAPKTIDLYGTGIQNEAACTDAVITPGMLVTRTATGVRPHNVAGETASPSFAVENDLVGGDISDDYAIGNDVIYRTFAAGSAVYALAHAGGAAIAANALLKSGGDGTLELASTDEVAVARALEAVDNSGGSDPVRIKVEVIDAQRTAPA
jgi:urocanate hydratase